MKLGYHPCLKDQPQRRQDRKEIFKGLMSLGPLTSPAAEGKAKTSSPTPTFFSATVVAHNILNPR